MKGRLWLTPTIVGVGILGLLGAYSFVPPPTQVTEQADAHSTSGAVHDGARKAHDGNAPRGASPSVDAPKDDRLQVHTHHAEPLGEKAYQDAPADVVLWGDLARALVVRKGSTYQTTFLPPVLALNGKTISIVGHVTTIAGNDKPAKQLLLSSHAFLCEECEPPTPTELVEVNTRDFVKAKDGVATIRGQFELVKNDPKGLVYRLNNAVLLKRVAH
jgi:hypothetical protein